MLSGWIEIQLKQLKFVFRRPSTTSAEMKSFLPSLASSYQHRSFFSTIGQLTMKVLQFLSLFFFVFFRPIWKQAYKGARTARGNAATASSQSLQMRMALVMSVTVMEFFVFQLPMSAIVLMAIFQTLFGPLVMQTNMTALCLLSKKRNNNVTSSNIQESRVTSGTTAAE